MASNNTLECYTIEGEEIINIRKELVDLYISKGKGIETVEFFKWACIRWLQMAELSVLCYHLENNEIVSKLINMGKTICNNGDPRLVDEDGKSFTDILLSLKKEDFVGDYDDEKYDQVDWSYNDFWWVNSSIEDWISLL